MLSLPLEAREQEATVHTSCFLAEVVMWISSIETVHQAAPEFLCLRRESTFIDEYVNKCGAYGHEH
jgi:hypothetical protein